MTIHYGTTQQTPSDTPDDLIRAVNAWCFERGVYVVNIRGGGDLLWGACHVKVQRKYGSPIWCVVAPTVAELIDQLNKWYADNPDGCP